VGHHDFTEEERERYRELSKQYGDKNDHFQKVLMAGKWGDRDEGVKRCWYCGSLEPVEMLSLFQAGRVVRYSGSDWKYGYPHKFYLDIDSGKPAVTYYVINDERVTKEEYDKAMADSNYRCRPGGGRSMGSGHERGTGLIYAKFYTEHLKDVEDKELFTRVTQMIYEKFRINFGIQDGKLMYSAPCHGYQASGGRP